MAKEALQAWCAASGHTMPCFLIFLTCKAMLVRKWVGVQECSRSLDLIPHAWNRRDTKQHLQMIVGPCGLMPQQLSLCGLNVEPWPLSWGLSLLFGTVFLLHHVCLLPYTTSFLVCAFGWPIYWKAMREVHLTLWVANWNWDQQRQQTSLRSRESLGSK